LADRPWVIQNEAVPRTVPFIRTLAVLAALAVLASEPAAAHPAPFSYVDVRIGHSSIDLALVVHVFDIAHELGIPIEQVLEPAVLRARGPAIRRLLGERLHVVADGRTPQDGRWSDPEPLPDRQSIRLRSSYTSRGLPAVVAVDALMFPYDAQHQTFVNVYEQDTLVAQSILDKERTRSEHFTGTRSGRLAVMRAFIAAGVHHILIGPDHLLFLIGLLLLGGSMRRLIVVVSAFTLAHSITLSLAALGVVNPPARVVEPIIALSIVFVGVDNLMVHGGRDVRTWIALTFGLIHGFGFAGVLREMGLARGALGWSLFSFNLGVEIGQLLVVAAVASALAALRARSETAGRRIAFGGSMVVAAAGVFWFVERVFFPGGLA
jgi:hydrogenase/urease accessory protein HupE